MGANVNVDKTAFFGSIGKVPESWFWGAVAVALFVACCVLAASVWQYSNGVMAGETTANTGWHQFLDNKTVYSNANLTVALQNSFTTGEDCAVDLMVYNNMVNVPNAPGNLTAEAAEDFGANNCSLKMGEPLNLSSGAGTGTNATQAGAGQ